MFSVIPAFHNFPLFMDEAWLLLVPVKTSADLQLLQTRCGDQGRNEVRWRPGHEASLAHPYSNLRSFGSKCTVLKKIFVKLLGLFGAFAVVWRPPQWFGARGIVRPFAPLATPLVAGRI